MTEVKTYRVTLTHDGGRINMAIVADDIVSAIERMCKIEGAPLCSVVAVKLISTKEV